MEVRVLEDNKLYDLYVEHLKEEQQKANIYKGKITRIEQSLGAAFVDFGAERHGFLPLKEISYSYLKKSNTESTNFTNIRDLVHENQEIAVQVEKEARGSKGAALTTFISLSASNLVLMPNKYKSSGISRHIEGKERDDLKTILSELSFPKNMSVIIRTVGAGKTKEELQWDLDLLLNQWNNIEKAITESSAPSLIYKEGNIIMRTIKDQLSEDIDEIIVDTPETYEEIQTYIQQTKPDFSEKIKLHKEELPLFSIYKIEKQIETAYQRTVNLPSGGSIVIDHTEALVSIDVNSSKSIKGKSIEETAYNTNMEAVKEISRQLRLRDIGGLIVIDFIDMDLLKNRRNVTNHMRTVLKQDRSKIKTGSITQFGLMEMSRQRLHSRLDETLQVKCPRCDGKGIIRSIYSLASSLVRLLEEEATKSKVEQIQLQLPIELATFLLNEKHSIISEIETRHNIKILIIPNQYLQTPKYKIRTLQLTALARKKEMESFKLIEPPKTEMQRPEINTDIKSETETTTPVVKNNFVQKPKFKKKNGLFKRFFNLFKKAEKKNLNEQNNKQLYRRNAYKNNRRYKK